MGWGVVVLFDGVVSVVEEVLLLLLVSVDGGWGFIFISDYWFMVNVFRFCIRIC